MPWGEKAVKVSSRVFGLSTWKFGVGISELGKGQEIRKSRWHVMCETCVGISGWQWRIEGSGAQERGLETRFVGISAQRELKQRKG